MFCKTEWGLTSIDSEIALELRRETSMSVSQSMMVMHWNREKEQLESAAGQSVATKQRMEGVEGLEKSSGGSHQLQQTCSPLFPAARHA